MTTLFFVRHGAHALQDRVLVGRTDVPLSAVGREQAERVAERLRHERVDMVQTSPQLRTRETADRIVDKLGLAAEIVPALDEVDVGDWTGRSFRELEADPRWKQWKTMRSMARAPSGETMLEVQVRVTRHIERVRAQHPDARIVLVAHSDVIRAAVLYHVGLSVDFFSRIEVSPGSLTSLSIDEHGAKLISLNDVMAG
jgi:broad specificity phosphatase PhoE